MAMDAVFVAEKALGRTPRDVSGQRGIGYDIESRDSSGDLWFIEVKGRAKGADQITLTRTEMLCALDKPGRFRLAIVVVDEQGSRAPVYVRGYDFVQPGFEQTSATFPLSGLIRAGGAPA